MNKLSTLTIAALGLMAFASGCAVDTADVAQEELGTSQEAVCSNESATNSIMAGMATDAALDMGRWLPDRDMLLVNVPWNDLNTLPLQLSQHAWPKCPNRNCARIFARLQLQDWDMQGMIVGGEQLNVDVLRNRLIANWDAQMTCINRPDNNAGDNCPWQQHDLRFEFTSDGACGKDYTFTAFVGNTTPRYSQNLAYPAQLKNMLIWAGYPNNPFLNFQSAGQIVKIDPPVEPPPPSGGGSGSCEQLVQYSSGACQTVLSATSNVRTIGACCKCGTGANMSWQWKAGVPAGTWYQCRL
jgi:hypothetical protein